MSDEGATKIDTETTFTPSPLGAILLGITFGAVAGIAIAIVLTSVGKKHATLTTAVTVEPNAPAVVIEDD